MTPDSHTLLSSSDPTGTDTDHLQTSQMAEGRIQRIILVAVDDSLVRSIASLTDGQALAV
jgi:hypothetical protein